jgi:hypothetical protein
MLASCHGPVPMSDAIVKGQEVKYSFKYDDEKTIYSQILRDLELAGELFNASTTWADDLKFPDLVFGSATADFAPNIAKWEKFANTFRLQIAMHAQNVLDPDTVRYHAQAALAQPTKLISALDEAVAPSFGTDDESSASWYFNRRKADEKNNSWNDGNFPIFSEYMFIYMYSYSDPRLPKFAMKSNAMAKRYDPLWVANKESVYMFEDTITRPHSCLRNQTGDAVINNCPDYEKHMLDGLNAYRRDSILVRYTTDYLPGEGSNAQLASTWSWAQEQRKTGMDNPSPVTVLPDDRTPRYSTITYRDNITRDQRKFNLSYVAPEFIAENAKVVMLSWADACFLKAEATLLIGGSEAEAKGYYEEGIKASFAQYGVTSTDTINAYLAQPGVIWGTDGVGYSNDKQMYRANINGATNGHDGKLEQIYKQRWLADFFNGLEGWNLERRTRAMNFLPSFLNGQSTAVDGYDARFNYWTERYIYPVTELNKNKDAYFEGINKLQAASPWKRTERNGDNVFTSLGFAKKIPDIETANDRFGRAIQLKTNCEYFTHLYGDTQEKIEQYAIDISGINIYQSDGITISPARRVQALAAGKGKICYEERTLLYWYYATEPPMP